MKEPKIVKKQIYDSTAKMITNIFFQGKLREEEMSFLLSFLDFVMVKDHEDNQELLEALQKYLQSEPDPENAEIIKHTLLSIDLNQAADRDSLLELIKELMPD